MSTTKVTGMMQTSTKGGDISSASPTVIDTDGDYFDVTGTTNFAAFTVVAGRRFTVQFDGILTMTHHATTLDLPGAANITTAAGDVAEFFATGTNTVQCVNYTRADGTAVVAGASGKVLQVLSFTGTSSTTSTSSTSFIDIDEIGTITLSATSSKTLGWLHSNAYAHSGGADVGTQSQVQRGVTVLTPPSYLYILTAAGDSHNQQSHTAVWLDSPSSTSEVAYNLWSKAQFGGTIQTAYAWKCILMEIGV
jgi:hypothetical protein